MVHGSWLKGARLGPWGRRPFPQAVEVAAEGLWRVACHRIFMQNVAELQRAMRPGSTLVVSSDPVSPGQDGMLV